MSNKWNYYQIKLFFLSPRTPGGPQTPLGAHSCSVEKEGGQMQGGKEDVRSGRGGGGFRGEIGSPTSRPI